LESFKIDLFQCFFVKKLYQELLFEVYLKVFH
jgi:hypothetical protein